VKRARILARALFGCRQKPFPAVGARACFRIASTQSDWTVSAWPLLRPSEPSSFPAGCTISWSVISSSRSSFPCCPTSPRASLALCEDEKSDARALEAVLERDPSLAAHVLRVANSAAYAPKEPIVSLQQAVSRLGLPSIRTIALGISLQGRVFQMPGHQSRVRSIWMHCAVAAVYARETARKLRRNVEGAFLCGLLHDIGRPVVLQATVDALAHRTKDPLPVPLLETAMDEFHAGVGARMVESWKLAD
jgi:putative nucleotidyltransferase with HDIG domain